MNTVKLRHQPQARQARLAGAERGAALLIVLIILILVTLMGLTTMRSANVQEKMSGGNADKSLAFQAGELALRDAELRIKQQLTSTSGFAANCSAGLCLPNTNGTAVQDTVDWSSNTVATYGAGTGAPALGGVSRQPSYIIELLPDMQATLGNSVNAAATGTPYRITAIGYGKQPETRVMLQSTYYKP